MIENNICLLTDSYKQWHHKAYLPNTEHVYSYLEARRGSKFPKTVFFGLQVILDRFFSGVVVTQEKIDEAERIITQHQGPVFNRTGWERILNVHGGKLPLRICAVPDGSVVDADNVLLTIENTDSELPWLTNFVESTLLHLWYPCTVGTLSYNIKKVFIEYLEQTADSMDALPWMLHDFGYRAVGCPETAAIGGAAHLPHFKGTDTDPALLVPINYYGAKGAVGFSVAATEHSIMTARGREGEFDVVQHVLNVTPTGILSMVIDSYDYENFIRVCGTRFKQQIDSRDGRVVFRPDSGDPIEVSMHCLELCAEYWGATKNSKGYKVLPNHIRILWGDGIDMYGMRSVLFAMENNGWSAENIVFGCGGGLLQRVDRDTQRFAFKCSAQFYDGEWHDVYKEPRDDSKRSKRGRLMLLKDENGYRTERYDEAKADQDQLVVVFENGDLTRRYTWDEIVSRAASE